jgi:hypothetical protein
MSGLDVGHVRKRLLEHGLGIEHVRCLDLTRVKAEGSGMSSPGTGYVREMLL